MRSKHASTVFSFVLLFSMVCGLPIAGRSQSKVETRSEKASLNLSRPVLAYSVVELGTFGGASAFARDINDRGQVTGNASLANGRLHAFLWEEGVMRDLGILTPGVDFSRGFSLNESGIVTGESDNESSKTFVYAPSNPPMVNLADLVTSNPDGLNITGGFGAGINNAGQIVGTSSRGAPSVIRAFLFSAGTVRDLGSIDGLTNTPARAWGVNDFGQVVGRSVNSSGVSHATLWQTPGEPVDLGSLGGQTAFSEALRINSRGQIVGRSTVTAGQNPQNAVLWENGEIISLGRLEGLNFARANDINDLGTVVGTSSQFEGFSGRAVIWQAGATEPTDLSGLLPEDSGWTLLTSAEGVNNFGQIVGFGTFGGQTRAFLMTPYDVCLTDVEKGVTILINSLSGDYRIIDCPRGASVSGRADASISGCLLRLRRERVFGRGGIEIVFDLCRLTGSAVYGEPDTPRTVTVNDNEQGNAPGCGGSCSNLTANKRAEAGQRRMFRE